MITLILLGVKGQRRILSPLHTELEVDGMHVTASGDSNIVSNQFPRNSEDDSKPNNRILSD